MLYDSVMIGFVNWLFSIFHTSPLCFGPLASCGSVAGVEFLSMGDSKMEMEKDATEEKIKSPRDLIWDCFKKV